MATIKKYNGSTWENAVVRKYGTATDTLTTLPADLYADGNSATVGLVGNMQQTGTPTHDNPIQPSECGERTANLFVETPSNPNYSLDFGGQLTPNDEYDVYTINVQPSTTYTLSFLYSTQAAQRRTSIHQYTDNGWISSLVIEYNENFPQAITTASNATKIKISIIKGTTNNMLNTGETALSYQPYGYKLDIKSGNTTTPVYLGQVQSMRKIKKLVLTGEESIALNGKYDANEILQAYYTLPSVGTTIANNIRCTHLKTLRSPSLTSTSEGITMRANGTDMIFGIPFAAINVSVSDSMAVALTKLIAYLQQQYSAGTPVTVWYVLATEETGIVNEPLRKIGTYADEVSGISIPTITGKDTFDVLTTLKPSEVELTYTGWHDATVKEWDGSEWQ